EAIGYLLNLVAAAPHVVLTDLLLFLLLLEEIDRLAAVVADRDLLLLAHLVQPLDVLLAALLGERRNVHADHRSLAVGGQAEVGLVDGALDGFDGALIVDLYGDRARLGDRYQRELNQRNLAAVVLYR